MHFSITDLQDEETLVDGDPVGFEPLARLGVFHVQALVMEQGPQLTLGLDALETDRDDVPLGHVSYCLDGRCLGSSEEGSV